MADAIERLNRIDQDAIDDLRRVPHLVAAAIHATARRPDAVATILRRLLESLDGVIRDASYTIEWLSKSPPLDYTFEDYLNEFDESVLGADMANHLLSQDGLDPHGFFVYSIWAQDDVPLYVGQSRNVLSRVGSHMGGRFKKVGVKRVRFNKFAHQYEMAEAERMLIKELQPKFNEQYK